PIPLGQLGPRSTSSNRMDVVLQSLTPKYGIGRTHPKTAARHGCIAMLLLSPVKNGGITSGLRGLCQGCRSEWRGPCHGDFSFVSVRVKAWATFRPDGERFIAVAGQVPGR